MTVTYDRYFSPVVLLRVEGHDADDLVMRMLSMDLVEDDRRLTEVVILFESFDAAEDDSTSLVEDERVFAGAQWELRWGYFDDLSPILALRVTKFRPIHAANGKVTVEVTLNTHGALMTRDSAARNWGRVQTSDIALRVAEANGLDANTEDSDDQRHNAYIQPANVSDMEFLQRLAARIHFVCFVESNVLHYHRPDYSEAPRMELVYYGGDPNSILQSMDPEVREIPARRAAAASAAADGDGDEESSDSEGVAGAAEGYIADARHVTLSRAVTTPSPEEPDDASLRRAHAAAQHINSLERAHKATAKCLGTPRLRRGQIINIRGVGRMLSGAWYIEKSRHQLGNSYTVEIGLKRAGVNLAVAVTVPGTPNTADAAEEAGSPNGEVIVNSNSVRYERPPVALGDS